MVCLLKKTSSGKIRSQKKKTEDRKLRIANYALELIRKNINLLNSV